MLVLEGVNARHLSPDDLPVDARAFDLVTIDVDKSPDDARLLANMILRLAAAVRPAGPPESIDLAGDDFLLARLDPLIDADPFRGARAPLGRPELIDVYPFEHHLHGFIDGFRRRYLSQRGRL